MPRKRMTVTNEDSQAEPIVATPAEIEMKPALETESDIEPSEPVAKLPKVVLRREGWKYRHFDTGKDPMSDAEKQYRYFETQPLVPFYCPLGWGEKAGAKQWCQVNDLGMWIDKGKMVSIPKPVADLLMESLRFTDEAQNPFVIDGDGRQVRAQSQSAEIQK